MGWNFDNSYTRLPKTFYVQINPTPVKTPKLIILNEPLAKDLGLECDMLKSKKGVSVLAGNEIPQNSIPIAQSYAGHQFGYFTMLGDGRAILLGEQITPDRRRFDIQLKGAGVTPFSRNGDGRAALGPMLREYIISEAMYALNIPTTRSLAVVETGEVVFREKKLKGAVLTRVASSHIRVGTFQYAANFCHVEELKELADYAITRHYPEIAQSEKPYVHFLREVIKRQASLISKWQLVGFIHGVMNTDNMTISGETIDYGPCAFMDTYNPETVFSSIDLHGRYAYGNQPSIGAWNLARFAESLIPILDENEEKAIELAQNEIEQYPKIYNEYFLSGMRKKLGLFNEQSEDKSIVEELLQLMENNKQDFTNTFICLSIKNFEDKFFQSAPFKKWHEKWEKRKEKQKEDEIESIQLMQKHNPMIIPRNYYVEKALEAAVEREDYSVMEELLKALEHPFDYNQISNTFCQVPPNFEIPYRTFCGT